LPSLLKILTIRAAILAFHEQAANNERDKQENLVIRWVGTYCSRYENYIKRICLRYLQKLCLLQ
jgi:hypothetical protein